jgi:hypothetical protein
VLWANVIDAKGALRKKKAWCPDCYREWQVAGQLIYDPLLWSFKQTTICVQHQQYLRERCPYEDCARSSLPLGWKSYPGYCSSCQRWLGSSNSGEIRVQSPAVDDEERWQTWVNATLGELLARAATISRRPTTQEVSERLSRVIDQATGGNIAAFGWLVGCAQPEVFLWVKQETRPHLGMLLRVCFTLHLSLFDILAPSPRPLYPIIPDHEFPTNISRRCLYRSSERLAVQLALDDILASADYPPASLGQVAQRLGYCTRVLRSCNAAACRAIALRFHAYRRQRGEERYC